MPRYWYNIAADHCQARSAVLHPGRCSRWAPTTAPLFPMELILQEVSTEREVPIPSRCARSSASGVRRRCSARRLERRSARRRASTTSTRASRRPARTSPTPPSRRPTYNQQAGIRRSPPRPAPGSGARARVRQRAVRHRRDGVPGRVSYDQKPYRRALMGDLRRPVHASPPTKTNCGRAILAKTPDHPGPLGIAISESRRGRGDQRTTPSTRAGSVLNHVLMHQTIIGQEAMLQLEMAATIRTSSSAAPAAAPTSPASRSRSSASSCVGRRQDQAAGRIVAVEPAACPSLTRGVYAYDFGDTAHMTPLTKMHARLDVHRRPDSTPAGCATTAWRRSST